MTMCCLHIEETCSTLSQKKNTTKYLLLKHYKGTRSINRLLSKPFNHQTQVQFLRLQIINKKTKVQTFNKKNINI